MPEKRAFVAQDSLLRRISQAVAVGMLVFALEGSPHGSGGPAQSFAILYVECAEAPAKISDTIDIMVRVE